MLQAPGHLPGPPFTLPTEKLSHYLIFACDDKVMKTASVSADVNVPYDQGGHQGGGRNGSADTGIPHLSDACRPWKTSQIVSTCFVSFKLILYGDGGEKTLCTVCHFTRVEDDDSPRWQNFTVVIISLPYLKNKTTVSPQMQMSRIRKLKWRCFTETWLTLAIYHSAVC